MILNTPSKQELLALVPRIHPDYKPVWDASSPDDQAALAAYFLPHRSKKDLLGPTRPKVIKWYCPFASQAQFPSGHRYCINVYVGCAHRCSYCYATAYGLEGAAAKRQFQGLIDRDLTDLDRFDVPPAPIHLSNSTDAFQPLEEATGNARYALEQILAHRHRFSTVTILTKNPSLPVRRGYIDLFKQLTVLPSGHPRYDEFERRGIPGFQVQVSLAFWRDAARAAYDVCAPSVEDRIEGVCALREAGIPVVLRIDPLFPRSPLPIHPSKTFADFGLVEPQTIDDLAKLVAFARKVTVRHVVYSSARVVQPRGRKLDDTMKAMRSVYQALSAPGKPVWRGGWRLPKEVSEKHVIEPFLGICETEGVKARYCMQDLIEIS